VETELSIAGMVKYCAEDDSALPLLQRWQLFVDKMAGDTEEVTAIARHIGALTGKLATILINLFDPEVFYVTGYITEVFGKLEPYFYNEIQQRCKMSLSRGLKIAVDKDVPQNTGIYIGLCDALYNGWNPLPANDFKG